MAWKSLPEVPDRRLNRLEWPSMLEADWLSNLRLPFKGFEKRDDSLKELEARALAELEKKASELEKANNTSADGLLVFDVITLLRLFQVEFLVSGKGDKVPISDLEGKVVGLYFYSPSLSDFVLRELNYMYEELRKQGKNFQLVVICLHRMVPDPILNITWHVMLQREKLIEKKFQNFFNGTTWLALPFFPCLSRSESNISLHQWSHVLRDSYEPAELVIIQPSENIAHAYAMDIFREFGIEAYPFSKSKLTELQVAKLKSWKLQSLLCSYEVEFPESFLSGKKILLILHPVREKRLGEWCKLLKTKDKAFAILSMCYEDQPHSCFPPPPQLGLRGRNIWDLPYDETMLNELTGILKYMGMRKNIDAKSTMVVAFGPDGGFITMTSSEKLFYDDECDFFDDEHLSSQVSYNIAIEMGWSDGDGRPPWHSSMASTSC